jgi:hypothetical protein
MRPAGAPVLNANQTWQEVKGIHLSCRRERPRDPYAGIRRALREVVPIGEEKARRVSAGFKSM